MKPRVAERRTLKEEIASCANWFWWCCSSCSGLCALPSAEVGFAGAAADSAGVAADSAGVAVFEAGSAEAAFAADTAASEGDLVVSAEVTPEAFAEPMAAFVEAMVASAESMAAFVDIADTGSGVSTVIRSGGVDGDWASITGLITTTRTIIITIPIIRLTFIRHTLMSAQVLT